MTERVLIEKLSVCENLKENYKLFQLVKVEVLILGISMRESWKNFQVEISSMSQDCMKKEREWGSEEAYKLGGQKSHLC